MEHGFGEDGEEQLPGRNTPLGFALRTGKNLEFVMQARDAGSDVHVVTQVVLSLLGLVVLPHETSVKSGEQKIAEVNHLLPVVVDDLWNVRDGPLYSHQAWDPPQLPITTTQLHFNLRNAIAHNNVLFSGNARSLYEVWLRFINCQRRSKGQQVNRQWVMDISGIDLLAFCRAQPATPPTGS